MAAFYFSVLVSLFWFDWKMRVGEEIDGQQTQSSSSSSSSIDSSNYPFETVNLASYSSSSLSSSSSSHSSSSCLSSMCRNATNSFRTDLITDLRLGLTISTSQSGLPNSNPRPRYHTLSIPLFSSNVKEINPFDEKFCFLFSLFLRVIYVVY